MAVDVTTLGIGVDSSGVRKATDDLGDFAKKGSDAAQSATGLERSMIGSTTAALQLDRAISGTVSVIARVISGFVSMSTAVGHYQDLAETTMGDPAGLASLRTSADVAGQSIDSVALMIQRMNVALSNSEDDSKAAGKGLALIGLDIEKFKQLKGDEQIRSLAKALDQYADSNMKMTIVQAVTGRGGAQQLVFLKELAGEQERVNIVTNEQIKLADDVSDAAARTRSTIRQNIEVMATGLLPAYAGVTSAVKTFIEKLLESDEEGKRVSKSKALEEFAWRMAGAFAASADVVMEAIDVVRIGAAAYMSFYDQLDAFLSRGKGIGSDENDAIRARYSALSDAIANRRTVSALLAEARAEQEAEAARRSSSPDNKPEIEQASLRADKGEKEKKDLISDNAKAYMHLQGAIGAVIAEQAALEASGERLTKVDHIRLDIAGKSAAAFQAMSPEWRKAILSYLDEADAAEKAGIAAEKRRKAMEQAVHVERQANIEAIRAVELARDQATAAEKADASYGKTARWLHELAMSERQRQKEWLTAQASYTEGNETVADALRAQAEQVQRLMDAETRLFNRRELERTNAKAGIDKAIREYTESAKDAGAAGEQFAKRTFGALEDGFTDLLATGGKSTRSLVDMMIAEFYRLLVVKPLLASLSESITTNGGIGGVLSKVGSFLVGGSGGSSPMGSGDYFGPLASGTDYVPSDGYAFLHEGEKVVPKAYNTSAGAEGQPIIMQTNNFSSGISQDQMYAALAQSERRTKAAVAEMFRRGNRSMVNG